MLEICLVASDFAVKMLEVRGDHCFVVRERGDLLVGKVADVLPRAPRAVSTREMASRMRSNNALIEARLTPARTGQMRTK